MSLEAGNRIFFEEMTLSISDGLYWKLAEVASFVRYKKYFATLPSQ